MEIKPPFQQGRVLLTETTMSWTQAARDVAQKHEERMVFANFTINDMGRGRQYVCECATPELAAFIVEACNGYAVLRADQKKTMEMLAISTNAMNTASAALEEGERVHAIFLTALKAIRHAKPADDDGWNTQEIARQALAAAGAIGDDA